MMWYTSRHWRYPPPPHDNSWRRILIRVMWAGLVVAAFMIILSLVADLW
jgi:hypothetical protein